MVYVIILNHLRNELFGVQIPVALGNGVDSLRGPGGSGLVDDGFGALFGSLQTHYRFIFLNLLYLLMGSRQVFSESLLRLCLSSLLLKHSFKVHLAEILGNVVQLGIIEARSACVGYNLENCGLGFQ